jgi:putative transposase
MQYLNRFNPIKLRKVTRYLEQAITEHNETAIRRKEILDFFDKYGLQATKDAYKISKSTLYNWKRQHKDNGIRGLIPLPKTPLHKRQSKVNSLVIEFITDYRNQYGKITQETIKPALDIYCKQNGIKTVSIATIGRIIRKLKKQGRITHTKRYTLNARSGVVKPYNRIKSKKQRINGYKPNNAGDLLQIDSVHLFACGVRKYIITAIDLKSRFAFSCTYDRLNSLNATDFMSKLNKVVPFKINKIQTDNGSEFEGYFANYLKANEIEHFHNYPRYPRGNAYIERFNRTIRQQYVNTNMDWIDDTKEFNKKLMEYLLWYNSKRPHKGIGYMTPLDYIANEITNNPEKSNMLRYLTNLVKKGNFCAIILV